MHSLSYSMLSAVFKNYAYCLRNIVLTSVLLNSFILRVLQCCYVIICCKPSIPEYLYNYVLNSNLNRFFGNLISVFRDFWSIYFLLKFVSINNTKH